MKKRTVVLLCVAAVVTPLAAKAAAGYFVKLKITSSGTPLVVEKSVLIRDFFLNPIPDFGQGSSCEGLFSLEEGSFLDEMTRPDEVLFYVKVPTSDHSLHSEKWRFQDPVAK